MDVAFRRRSVRAVLPSSWELFTFPQEELQGSTIRILRSARSVEGRKIYNEELNDLY
jgi:hypothetical protein